MAVIGLLVIASAAVGITGFIRERTGPAAKIKLARLQAFQIAVAFDTFLRGYGSGRMPMTTNAMAAASPDFVYGTYNTGCPIEILNAGGDYQANNAEIMAILMAARQHPDGSPSVNADDYYNPDRGQVINPPLAADTKSPGLGPDGVFRDPWGNPYIVAVDVDANYVTESHFKGIEKPPVLPQATVTGEIQQQSDYFCAQTRILVWSFGPDGKADPALKVTEGVNADNVYTWR